MQHHQPDRRRIMISGSRCFLVLLVTLTAACAQRDNHNHPDLKTGEALFNHHCAECHGQDGTGMLADQTPANILTHLSRDEIVNYITTPVNPQRKMPVFSGMPTAEAVAIADHLLELKQRYLITPENKKKPEGLLIKP